MPRTMVRRYFFSRASKTPSTIDQSMREKRMIAIVVSMESVKFISVCCESMVRNTFQPATEQFGVTIVRHESLDVNSGQDPVGKAVLCDVTKIKVGVGVYRNEWWSFVGGSLTFEKIPNVGNTRDCW